MQKKKIYKFKQSFSLSDAANRLTHVLAEPVGEKDLIELALEGHIQLHWYMRHVPALQVELRDEKIPLILDEDRNLIKYEEDWKTVTIRDYFPIEENGQVFYHTGPHALLHNECGALSDYLRSYLTGTGGELMALDGYNVRDDDGNIWSVRELFHESYLDDSKKNWDPQRFGPYHLHSARNFFPTGEWPNFSELGFTKSELEKLENNLDDKPTKEVSTRERDTLLKLIIGLATDGYGYDPNALRSPFPKELEGILVGAGISVSDDTIRKWLKEAAQHLPQNIDGD